jgi:protein ImuA
MLASLSPSESLSTAARRRPDGHAAELAGLRARVRAIERGAAYGGARRRAAPLGAAGLDAHLPGGGLPLGALHEIEGGRAEWDDGAATGFCAGLLARLLDAVPERQRGKPVLWISPWRDLYAPGLRAFGLDPGRLILVRAGAGAAGAEVLWAMEEGLRCARLAAVVGEIDALERGPGRRLQLAAETGGVTAFALRRGLRPARRGAGPSAAVTRWRVEAETLAGRLGAGERGRFPERRPRRITEASHVAFHHRCEAPPGSDATGVPRRLRARARALGRTRAGFARLSPLLSRPGSGARAASLGAVIHMSFADKGAMELAWAAPEGQAATTDNANLFDLAESSWSVVEAQAVI